MIEVYAFLAMFLVQILVMSVLYPLQFSRLSRAGLKSIPADRLAQHYPGIDFGRAHERFIARYRVANVVIVVLGLFLLGWFFIYMNRAHWNESAVGGLLTTYFFLQNCPTLLIAWFTTRFNKVHRRSFPEKRRKAILQRRGLFDFVSPLAVVLAALSYSSFAAFMFYVDRHPFPGFGGPLLNIGIVTAGYILLGFVVYRYLYGKKIDPLQTHADRMRMISVTVNTAAWTCVVFPLLVSLTIVRQLLDLDTWGPFTGSVFFLVLGLISFRAISTPPRSPEADEPGSGPVHQ